MPENDRTANNIDTLFESRRQHGERIARLEEGYTQIKLGQDEIKETIRENQKEIKRDIMQYRQESIGDIETIQEVIDKFIEDINGVPKQNRELIEHQHIEIHALEHNMEDINNDLKPIKDCFDSDEEKKKNNEKDLRHILVEIIIIILAASIIAIFGWVAGKTDIFGRRHSSNCSESRGYHSPRAGHNLCIKE
jgi:hypothetical protein